MSIYDEVFAQEITETRDPFLVFVAKAMCANADEVRALADEVRALRTAIATLIQDRIAANIFAASEPLATGPLFPAEPAKSERIQYPFCQDCNRYHHPDDWTCPKNSPPIQCKNCNHPAEEHASSGECMAGDPVGDFYKCGCRKFEAAATPADAQRFQHPFCDVCGLCHGPKWPRCKKQHGVTAEMITPPATPIADALREELGKALRETK